MKGLMVSVLVLVTAVVTVLVTNTVAAPTQIFVPAYQVSYSAQEDLLKQILIELKGLRQDIQGLTPNTAPASNGASLLGSRCAGCHQDGVAETKGGGFVIVEKNGTLAELSLAEKRRMVRLVTQGKMPPTGALSVAEQKAISGFLSPQPQKEKPK